MNISNYNKIMIIGNNGSGKSYFAKELSKITKLPLIHLDLEYWLPDWKQVSQIEWSRKQAEFTAKEKWIIDGNYTETMEVRFEKAELIIFLDINRLVCLLSVLKRRHRVRSDFPDYLKYEFNKEFLKFCKRLLEFPKMRKQVIIELHNKYPDKTFLVINKRRLVNKILKQWKEECFISE